MVAGNSRLSSASRLAQRLLWNRPPGAGLRPLPVVVLLGPVGAGKTWALRSISRDCGSSVVHAPVYDFAGLGPEPATKLATTMSALAEIALGLSRDWRGRPKAHFHRLTLGWIAAHQPLGDLPYAQAKAELRKRIDDLTRKSAAGISVAAGVLVDAASAVTMLPEPAADALKQVLPPLIQRLSRRQVREAELWHSHSPGAEGARPLDALYALNRLAARGQTDAVTAWLMDAFLADVRRNYERMARLDARSSCGCEVPGRGPHGHNWVVLLDNVDHPAGTWFIADLLSARERELRRHPRGGHDPLLLVTASGRWDRSWQPAWRPPWESALATPGGSQAVPNCRRASYDDWCGSRPEGPRSPYYPVLLEPLSAEEVAEMIGIPRYTPECEFACRATGGLPGAVDQVKPLMRDRRIEPGRRDALVPCPSHPGADPWSERLGGLRLVDQLLGLTIADVVAAAPYATAPWLVPHDAGSLTSHPNVGRILTELRTALWVTAASETAATKDHAQLHPWLASTLNFALAHSAALPDGPSYHTQFTALLRDQTPGGDPVRRAYCQLALRGISYAVDLLTASFDELSHREWVSTLALITSAPDNMPLDQTSISLYGELVEQDCRERAEGRSPARNTIARIVAARWVDANRFTMPDPSLRHTLTDCCVSLRALSKRPDVSELQL